MVAKHDHNQNGFDFLEMYTASGGKLQDLWNFILFLYFSIFFSFIYPILPYLRYFFYYFNMYTNYLNLNLYLNTKFQYSIYKIPISSF